MTLQRSLYLLLIVGFVSGCANMSAPRHIAAASCKDDRASSICLLDRLQLEYESYSTGAAKSQAATDGLMLASAAIGTIGAAVGSSSELYKSAGAIGLSALGFSTYGNFKTQDRVTREANGRLACARPRLEKLLKLSDNGNSFLQGMASFDLTKHSATLSISNASQMKASIEQDKGAKLIAEIQNHLNMRNNAKTADNILANINSDATELIMKLQDGVTKTINDESFDVEKSIKVITTKPKLSTDSEPTPEVSFLTIDKLSAEAVIDTYNAFIQCMAGEQSAD